MFPHPTLSSRHESLSTRFYVRTSIEDPVTVVHLPARVFEFRFIALRRGMWGGWFLAVAYDYGFSVSSDALHVDCIETPLYLRPSSDKMTPYSWLPAPAFFSPPVLRLKKLRITPHPQKITPSFWNPQSASLSSPASRSRRRLSKSWRPRAWGSLPRAGRRLRRRGVQVS